MVHTLVTGANSFVGAHVVKTLLNAGHRVTGTVRRQAAGDTIMAAHPEWAGLTLIVIEDYTVQASWDNLFASLKFDHIIHVAAPLLDNAANTDYDRDFLRPSVEG
jgi:nucleoside-diphosphate-sugar epimerase